MLTTQSPSVARYNLTKQHTRLALTRNLASTSELEGSQAKHNHGKHIPKVLDTPNGRPPLLYTDGVEKLAIASNHPETLCFGELSALTSLNGPPYSLTTIISKNALRR
jgi:hypothetical protein